MNSIICAHCRDNKRVAKPVMVPYLHRYSPERRFVWCCSYCDGVETWPVFTRSHPAVPKE